MIGRTVMATLAGAAPQQRLQVALAQRGDGRLLIDLREQHYAEGIGWYDQRTIELDPRQFRQLQAVLGLKEGELASLTPPVHDAPATIPFPGPCEHPHPKRSAAGEGA